MSGVSVIPHVSGPTSTTNGHGVTQVASTSK